MHCILQLFILFILFINTNGVSNAADIFEKQAYNGNENVGSFKRFNKYLTKNSLQEISYYENENGISTRLNSHTLEKDWPGIKRDMYYFVAYQFMVVGILYVSPENISEWDREQKDSASLDKYLENIDKIVWDHDALWINYIMHPYWGGAYYVRARERGYDKVESFWFSALFSAMYEFGVEAIFEEPSIQDLIVTPVVGTYVGQYFMKLRSAIKKKKQYGRYDRLLLVLTDPLGSLNNQVDKLIGRNVHTSLAFAIISPSPAPSQKYSGNNLANRLRGTEIPGLKLTISWR